MTALDVLKAARKLLSGRGAWTQGTAARDSQGFRASVWSDDAACWCLAGAIAKTGLGAVEASDEARGAVDAEVPDNEPLVLWNDHPKRTKRQVLALLDRAIAKQEAKRRKRCKSN